MRVFISGPMSTSGEPGPNLHQAVVAAAILMRSGHTPFVPHLTWIADAISPCSIDQWMRWDKEWLLQCEAVIRLPGDSRGADEEVRLARENEMPVYESVNELLRDLEG